MWSGIYLVLQESIPETKICDLSLVIRYYDIGYTFILSSIFYNKQSSSIYSDQEESL